LTVFPLAAAGCSRIAMAWCVQKNKVFITSIRSISILTLSFYFEIFWMNVFISQAPISSVFDFSNIKSISFFSCATFLVNWIWGCTITVVKIYPSHVEISVYSLKLELINSKSEL
jgi:hypothetical protein